MIISDLVPNSPSFCGLNASNALDLSRDCDGISSRMGMDSSVLYSLYNAFEKQKKGSRSADHNGRSPKLDRRVSNGLPHRSGIQHDDEFGHSAERSNIP